MSRSPPGSPSAWYAGSHSVCHLGRKSAAGAGCCQSPGCPTLPPTQKPHKLARASWALARMWSRGAAGWRMQHRTPAASQVPNTAPPQLPRRSTARQAVKGYATRCSSHGCSARPAAHWQRARARQYIRCLLASARAHPGAPTARTARRPRPAAAARAAARAAAPASAPAPAPPGGAPAAPRSAAAPRWPRAARAARPAIKTPESACAVGRRRRGRPFLPVTALTAPGSRGRTRLRPSTWRAGAVLCMPARADHRRMRVPLGSSQHLLSPNPGSQTLSSAWSAHTAGAPLLPRLARAQRH